jgi:NAD/NADP transhydrogenase beta subunit
MNGIQFGTGLIIIFLVIIAAIGSFISLNASAVTITNATLPNNSTIAISAMTMFSDTPVKVTDTQISTGSLQFTGSALVFHKTTGEPFTVTYTVDAVARTPNH